MAKLKRQEFLDFSGGVQARTVTPLALNRQVSHLLNGELSTKLGAITGRKGSEVLSTVLDTKEVLTLLQWVKSDGTVRYFASLDDGETTPKVDLYINSDVLSGSWTKSLEDLTTGKDIWGTNFINKLFVCNGNDIIKAWDGSTWSAVTNAPAAGKFPEVFGQRLFLLSESGFLHYSDVINSTGDDFTTTEWLDRGINPNDGQKCKMLKRHRGQLIILKEESIYKYDGTNSPEARITVGTHSSKSVVVLNDLFFHHPTGIYRMGVGDPIMISRAVQKYLDGMSNNNWENVSAGRDLENLYFWIGDVTIDDPFEKDYGKTYSNVVLVYNVYAKNWTVYSNWDARTWFYDKTSGLTYFGTSAGKIVRINTGYKDVDGSTITPINFDVIFMPKDLGYPERDKEFGMIKVVGQYNSDILIAEDYDSLVTQKELNQKKAGGKITCKELWIGVSEEYEDRPPRIRGLILDNINLLDNAN